MLRKIIGWLKAIKDNDPVYSCDVYKNEGCSHVDGYLCDMKDCSILTAYKAKDLHCVVCGYYCLGKGGLGCIDKPKLCEPFMRGVADERD